MFPRKRAKPQRLRRILGKCMLLRCLEPKRFYGTFSYSRPHADKQSMANFVEHGRRCFMHLTMLITLWSFSNIFNEAVEKVARSPSAKGKLVLPKKGESKSGLDRRCFMTIRYHQHCLRSLTFHS